MDFSVVTNNFVFLIAQGFLGIGAFTGGTLRLAVPAIVLGFILGTLVGLARLSQSRWLHWPAKVYIEFFRGVPLVMVIFWFWFIIPVLIGKSLPEYSVALTAFVVFEAAYLGEIVRAGIQSIPNTQLEAALSTGLTIVQAYRLIIVPIALRLIIPPATNESLNLLKNSSVALTIGVAELTFQTRQIETYTAKAFEALTAGTLIYLILCLAIAFVMARVERRYAIPGLIAKSSAGIS